MEWFNAVDATYRSDLRELNELNFARFDAKLEQRATQLDAKIDQRFGEVRAEIREGLARLEGRFQSSLHELKAELLKWMFGTIFAAWATLLGAMIALIKLG